MQLDIFPSYSDKCLIQLKFRFIVEETWKPNNMLIRVKEVIKGSYSIYEKNIWDVKHAKTCFFSVFFFFQYHF